MKEAKFGDLRVTPDGDILWKDEWIGGFDPEEREVYSLFTLESCINAEMTEDETVELFRAMPKIISTLIRLGLSIKLEDPELLLSDGLEVTEEEIRRAYRKVWNAVYGS